MTMLAVIIGDPAEDPTGVMYANVLQERGVGVRWKSMNSVLDSIVVANCSIRDFDPQQFTGYESLQLLDDEIAVADIAFLVSNRLAEYSSLVNAVVQSVGVVMPNQWEAVRDANDKWRTVQLLEKAGLATPNTDIAYSIDDAWVIADHLSFPLVLKKLDGNRGDHVVLVNSIEQLRDAFGHLNVNGSPVLMQHYIECGALDKRIIVIGGEFVVAMCRRAKRGEFRSNLAQGGTAHSCEVTPEEVDLAIAAADALGLQFAGLDVAAATAVLPGREYVSMGQPFLLEVNAMPALDMPLVHGGVDGSQVLVGNLLSRLTVV